VRNNYKHSTNGAPENEGREAGRNGARKETEKKRRKDKKKREKLNWPIRDLLKRSTFSKGRGMVYSRRTASPKIGEGGRDGRDGKYHVRVKKTNEDDSSGNERSREGEKPLNTKRKKGD